MPDRPTLLFYCQHSVGLGHLVRSLALIRGLLGRFHVVLLNGGPMPDGIALPEGMEVVQLPALGHDDDYRLVSRDPRWTTEAAMWERERLVLEALRHHRPRAVVIELYPFGRKKFRFELGPLLDEIHAQGAGRPLVACSLRDILVASRPDQALFEDGVSRELNARFDVVLMHSDPRFATLEETFSPATPLRVPVRYTGFVVDETGPPPAGDRRAEVIVSAGGGLVGAPLVRAAVDAFPLIRERVGLDMRIVAGPFLPDADWDALDAAARATPGLTASRYVPGLPDEIARAAVSVSQCGYNTAMHLLRARTPSLVVPFSEGLEDEQEQRAERLRRLGLLRVLRSADLTAEALAGEVAGLVGTTPAALELDMDGAAATARIVAGLTADAAVGA